VIGQGRVSSRGSEVLPDRVRKLGKMAGYDWVSRNLIGKRSGKMFGRDSVNPIGCMYGHDSGKTLGDTLGYDSSSNSGKASGAQVRLM
jgi:hypothetical protein